MFDFKKLHFVCKGRYVKQLTCCSPFSFEPTTGDKPIEKAITHEPDVDDSYIQDRHDNDAFYMQSEDIYETESLKPRLNQKTKGKDEKKSSFQASNSATSEMEFSSDDESVFNTKLSVIPDVFDDVSQSGAMKVLRDLKNKIAAQPNKKYPVKSVDQISLKQASTPSKIGSLDGQNKVFKMNSLMAAVSQVPKLQELHSAQLQHGTVLSVVKLLFYSILLWDDNLLCTIERAALFLLHLIQQRRQCIDGEEYSGV